MTELKPCPFCGPKAFIIPTTKCDPQAGKHCWTAELRCHECGLNISRTAATEKEALDQVIKAWNTRAERTCHPVEKFTEDSPWPVMVCSECGRQLHYDEHREISYQPYCGCGAKVVE